MAGLRYRGRIRIGFLGLTAAAALTFTATAVRAQLLVPTQAESRADQLATGKILVAERSLLDPNFAKTVILLVQYDEGGTVGLILNRQTKIPLSRLARELEGAKGRSDPLYLGGPVATTGMLALLRSRAKLEDAQRVLADVYLASTKETLQKAVAARSDSSAFRLYMGYAGWAAEQLEWEVGMEAWNILPADAGIVFDAHPETLWSRLIEREDLQMAWGRSPTCQITHPPTCELQFRSPLPLAKRL